MTCKELMTSEPAFCVPGDTAVTAATLMKSHDIGSVPVVSDRESKHVVGMITDRDIAMRVVAGKREYDKTHVGDVMSKDVVTCRAEDDYDEVIQAMEENQIRRVPVIDSERRLIGIVSLADVARKAGKPEGIAEVTGEISKPSHGGQANGKGRFAKTGLLVAGGLGAGVGLIYLLDPKWARGARKSVASAAGKVRDSIKGTAKSAAN
jgi:CBS domain-containing protein